MLYGAQQLALLCTEHALFQEIRTAFDRLTGKSGKDLRQEVLYR